MSDKESKTIKGPQQSLIKPAESADELDLLNNIKDIRSLMTSLDFFNFKVQQGNPDLSEEVRQGCFVAVNKSKDLANILFEILKLIEEKYDY